MGMRSRALRGKNKTIPTVVDMDEGLVVAIDCLSRNFNLTKEDVIRRLLHHGINLSTSTLRNVLKRPFVDPLEDVVEA